MEKTTHRSTNQSKPSDPLSYKRVIKDTPPARNAFEEYTAFVLSKVSATTTEMRIQQGIIGAATETGELLDALKKHMFQGRSIDVINIKEECGDLWFYFTELMAAVDTNIFEVMEMNKAKLSKRYSNKFTPKESIKRDTDQERKILEETTSKYSCESCVDTDCSSKPLPQRVYKGYMNNRNYPVNTAQQIALDRQSPPAPKAVACCGNCAERLALNGCETYSEVNDNGCCINHKFM